MAKGLCRTFGATLVSGAVLLGGRGAAAVDSLDDAASLVQVSQERAPSNDVYVTTANTVEDVMYWTVMYMSMKQFHHMYPSLLNIRQDGELNQRAHAIRMAIQGNYWNARLDLFKPEALNLEAVGMDTWQHLAPFQYGPDEFKRVTNLAPDMVVFRNIDSMTHRPFHFAMTRDQGECRNLTEAKTSTKPGIALYSLIPDTGMTQWLASAGTRLLAEGVGGAGRRLRPLDNASLVSLAYEKVHPGHAMGQFGANEVVSASCFVHHKDMALQENGMLEGLQVMHLGTEGKKIISDIIEHGVGKRLENSLKAMKDAGRHTLAAAVETWFKMYNTTAVKNVLDAAMSGPIAEW